MHGVAGGTVSGPLLDRQTGRCLRRAVRSYLVEGGRAGQTKAYSTKRSKYTRVKQLANIQLNHPAKPTTVDQCAVVHSTGKEREEWLSEVATQKKKGK